jgi:hypothetical protein
VLLVDNLPWRLQLAVKRLYRRAYVSLGRVRQPLRKRGLLDTADRLTPLGRSVARALLQLRSEGR